MPPSIATARADVLKHALAAVPGLTVVVLAATRFSDAARSPDGAAAGAILVVVGCVVGQVLAGEKVRPLAIIMSSTFALVLCSGWIDQTGSERTLLAFSCICGGILWGACSPLRNDDQEVEVIVVEALPSSADETTLRS